MGLSFCSFSSGSSGNCYLIKNKNTAILVDAGISCKRILMGLEKVETGKEEVAAIFVTHEHGDHISALATLGKRMPNVPMYANEATWENIKADISAYNKRIMEPGESVKIADIEVKAYATSHDSVKAQAYSFSCEGKKIAIVTDTGCVTDEIFANVIDADMIILEANYEEEVLLLGKYPYFLKHRILGEHGHLSNVAAAEVITRIMKTNKAGRVRRVFLAHLSKENNMPELAYQTVVNCLEEEGIYIGEELKLSILLRDCISDYYTI